MIDRTKFPPLSAEERAALNVAASDPLLDERGVTLMRWERALQAAEARAAAARLDSDSWESIAFVEKNARTLLEAERRDLAARIRALPLLHASVALDGHCMACGFGGEIREAAARLAEGTETAAAQPAARSFPTKEASSASSGAETGLAPEQDSKPEPSPRSTPEQCPIPVASDREKWSKPCGKPLPCPDHSVPSVDLGPVLPVRGIRIGGAIADHDSPRPPASAPMSSLNALRIPTALYKRVFEEMRGPLMGLTFEEALATLVEKALAQAGLTGTVKP